MAVIQAFGLTFVVHKTSSRFNLYSHFPDIGSSGCQKSLGFKRGASSCERDPFVVVFFGFQVTFSGIHVTTTTSNNQLIHPSK